jgi:hypothetical protein
LLGKRSDFHWNGVEDDSLTLYTSFSEITLAEVGARWATETVKEMTADRLLLTTSDPVPFVAALRGMNAPDPGSSQVSVERPILPPAAFSLQTPISPPRPPQTTSSPNSNRPPQKHSPSSCFIAAQATGNVLAAVGVEEESEGQVTGTTMRWRLIQCHREIHV